MNSSFSTWTSSHASIRTTLRDFPGGVSGVLAAVQITTDDSEVSIHFETAERFIAFCEQFNVPYEDKREGKEKEPAHIQCGTGSDVPAGLEARQMQSVSRSTTAMNSR